MNKRKFRIEKMLKLREKLDKKIERYQRKYNIEVSIVFTEYLEINLIDYENSFLIYTKSVRGLRSGIKNFKRWVKVIIKEHELCQRKTR